jgi:uncharacterized membrane protein YidH (DUF202 family)
MTNPTASLTPLPSADTALGIAIRIELERLATIRTAYSSERSLNSWLSTAVSLYTFGFAVAKFLAYVAEQPGASPVAERPHWLGLALIVTGIVSLLLALVQYLSRLATMRELGLHDPRHYLLTAVAAGVLAIIGIAVAISISLN